MNLIKKAVPSVCILLCYSVSYSIIYTDSVFANKWGIEAWSEPERGGAGAIMSWNIDESDALTPGIMTLPFNHVWFIADLGQMFDANFVTSQPEFANLDADYRVSYTMTIGEDFYLAFWLDANGDSNPSLTNDDRYGWAKLNYDGTDITLLGNAISYSAIEVGTVPEPSTCAAILGLSAIGLVMVRRRKRR